MPLSGTEIAALVLGIAVYLTLNITGTIYYTKLEETRPVQVSDALMNWNLASVILGWLMLPPLNLSSSIVYATYADQIEARNEAKGMM